MSNTSTYIPFSQRNGFEEIPPQLKLGEVSDELRRLLNYYIRNEIERVERSAYHGSYFGNNWKQVAMDLYVVILGQKASSFNNDSHAFKLLIDETTETLSIGPLFDIVEFFVRHPDCSDRLKADLAGAFITARAAYRVVDGQILAIGQDEQAAAFLTAITEAEEVGANGARSHLVGAGAALRDGNWADSIRESIHAVEAMARRINPKSKTLGDALKALENKGYLHGSLKSGFERLYGYTNDENGIRHALTEAEANVDETDALFMLGACAAFVSYLIARESAASRAD